MAATVPEAANGSKWNETVKKFGANQFDQPSNIAPAATVSRRDMWYIVGGFSFPSQFVAYDVTRRTWSTLPDLPWNRHSAGTCAVNNKIVVMGGVKANANFGDPTNATIDEFDIPTAAWTTRTVKLNAGRPYLTACADKQYAYAFGGLGMPHYHLAERYRPGSTATADGPFAKKIAKAGLDRDACGACYKGEYNAIFTVGGRKTGGGSQGNIEKYDISRNKWTTLKTKMEFVRAGMGTALLGDDLYIAGGTDTPQTATKAVEIFNIRLGEMREAPDLVKEHDGCSAVVLNHNVVCVMGGFGMRTVLRSNNLRDICTAKDLDTVEAYDVREGRWSTGVIVPNMPKGVGYFGFASV